MSFWALAYKQKWIDAEGLKGAVITESNPFGEITEAEYETITGIKFK